MKKLLISIVMLALPAYAAKPDKKDAEIALLKAQIADQKATSALIDMFRQLQSEPRAIAAQQAANEAQQALERQMKESCAAWPDLPECAKK